MNKLNLKIFYKLWLRLYFMANFGNLPYDYDVICNICSKPPTWLQKVEYLLNKSTDLNETLNLSSGNRQ